MKLKFKRGGAAGAQKGEFREVIMLQNMCKICAKYVQNMCKICAKCLENLKSLMKTDENLRKST